MITGTSDDGSACGDSGWRRVQTRSGACSRSPGRRTICRFCPT